MPRRKPKPLPPERMALVLEFLGRVRGIAGFHSQRYFWIRDELFQVAAYTLVKCARLWKPKRGPFENYVSRSVRRNLLWVIRTHLSGSGYRKDTTTLGPSTLLLDGTRDLVSYEEPIDVLIRQEDVERAEKLAEGFARDDALEQVRSVIRNQRSA